MTLTSERSTRLEEWTFEPSSGALSKPGEQHRLEPKVADLLSCLTEHSGRVVTREELTEQLWPDVVVGEDALPRCVSKLRRALGDDPRSPRFVETVPKRGYRLLVEPSPLVEDDGPDPEPPSADASEDASPPASRSPAARPPPATSPPAARPPAARPPAARRRLSLAAALACALAGALVAAILILSGPREPREPQADEAAAGDAERLVEQAGDFYFQIDRSGNESAIELYQRALAEDPDFAPAHAGLANALVQKVLRYPATEGLPKIEPVNLGNALASGRLSTDEARSHLQRALALAERSVRLAGEDAASHRAHGFVLSALGRLDEAERSYRRAVELDPDAWEVLVNLGDIHEIRGRPDEALGFFEQAYDAMNRVYDEQPLRVRPWLSELGVLIGAHHEAAGRLGAAEVWFRRTLADAPLHKTATCALADLLRRAGDDPAASRLEDELFTRLGEEAGCQELLADLWTRAASRSGVPELDAVGVEDGG